MLALVWKHEMHFGGNAVLEHSKHTEKRSMVSAKLTREWVHRCANVDYAGNCWNDCVKPNELQYDFKYNCTLPSLPFVQFEPFFLGGCIFQISWVPFAQPIERHFTNNNSNDDDKKTTEQLNGWDIDADACMKCAIVLRPAIVHVRNKTCCMVFGHDPTRNLFVIAEMKKRVGLDSIPCNSSSHTSTHLIIEKFNSINF